MKRLNIITALVLTFTFSVCTGCKSAIWDTLLPKSQVLVKPQSLTTNTVVTTNFVSETVFKTNIVTIDVTNAITHEVTQTPQAQVTPQLFLTPVITTNQFVATNAAVYASQVDTGRIESGTKDAGAVLGNIGVPFATAIAGIVGLLVRMSGSFFNRRQIAKLKDKHNDAMDVAKDALKTVVQNVEQARGVIKQFPGGDEIDAKLMSYVQKAQALAGPEVNALIASHVEEHTSAIEIPKIV